MSGQLLEKREVVCRQRLATPDSSNHARFTRIIPVRSVKKVEFEIRLGRFRIEAITLFKQEIPPACLRKLAIRDRADADAFLQQNNLAYALGLRLFEIFLRDLSGSVIMSRLQKAFGPRKAADMFGAERWPIVLIVHLASLLPE